jgi:hypothetical protein
VITTAPGSAVQSNGSTVCMIGGSGNRLAKIARTKWSPDIDAITSIGTMPYSIACLPDLSSMISQHTRRYAGLDVAFMIVQGGLSGQARHLAAVQQCLLRSSRPYAEKPK